MNSFNIGKRISDLLRDTGHTQLELARYLSVKPAAVSVWISGRGYPQYERIISIARFFRLSLPQFFSESPPDEMSSPSILFIQDQEDLRQIPPGSIVRVEIRTRPEIGDIVLYQSGQVHRLLRLAAYRDGIYVLESDNKSSPPVIARESESEIAGTAAAIILKKDKKIAATVAAMTDDRNESDMSTLSKSIVTDPAGGVKR